MSHPHQDSEVPESIADHQPFLCHGCPQSLCTSHYYEDSGECYVTPGHAITFLCPAASAGQSQLTF